MLTLIKRCFCLFPQLLKSLSKQNATELIPTVERIMDMVQSQSTGVANRARLIQAWTVQDNIHLFTRQFVYSTIKSTISVIDLHQQQKQQVLKSMVKMPRLGDIKPIIQQYLEKPKADMSLEQAILKLQLASKFSLHMQVIQNLVHEILKKTDQLDTIQFYGLMSLMQHSHCIKDIPVLSRLTGRFQESLKEKLEYYMTIGNANKQLSFLLKGLLKINLKSNPAILDLFKNYVAGQDQFKTRYLKFALITLYQNYDRPSIANKLQGQLIKELQKQWDFSAYINVAFQSCRKKRMHFLHTLELKVHWQTILPEQASMLFYILKKGSLPLTKLDQIMSPETDRDIASLLPRLSLKPLLTLLSILSQFRMDLRFTTVRLQQCLMQQWEQISDRDQSFIRKQYVRMGRGSRKLYRFLRGEISRDQYRRREGSWKKLVQAKKRNSVIKHMK